MLLTRETTLDPQAVIPLPEIKNWLRITSDTEDQTILNVMSAACDNFEKITGIILTPSRWSLNWSSPFKAIRLAWSPITRIANVKALNIRGELISENTNLVRLETGSLGHSIHLNQVLAAYARLEIELDAGYQSRSDIPPAIKLFLLRQCAELYDNRTGEIKSKSASGNLSATNFKNRHI